MKKREKRTITAEEHLWMMNHKYVIRPHWIGYVEGWSYLLYTMGGIGNGHDNQFLCERKSERACFNFARRLVANM
jgi:hypothetical protein